MKQRRTDLALEAKEIWEESASETTKLSGVIAREEERSGYRVTHVEILDEAGEAALGKPRGQYITLEMPRLCRREKTDYWGAAAAVAEELSALLPTDVKAPVLVAGLGNRAMTPDAIGPLAMDYVLVTRHLIHGAPEHFGEFRPVSALAAGVMGDTGMESGEIIKAAVAAVQPACVIAVDALASRSSARMFTTIQISSTGIVPGSGVGNHRMAIDEETIGVPVISLGVPTVVSAATLCLDLLEKGGQGRALPKELLQAGAELFVTPGDVDKLGETVSKILGLGISRALHVDLSVEDVEMFLS